jgi:hypothetical protein
VARPSDLQLPDLPQVLDGGIPEHLWLPVVKPREPFREMSREPLKLRGEGLLGQLDGTFETLTDPGLLGLIHVGGLGCRPAGCVLAGVGGSGGCGGHWVRGDLLVEDGWMEGPAAQTGGGSGWEKSLAGAGFKA